MGEGYNVIFIYDASCKSCNTLSFIFLGDLFDEGKWCSDAEFQDYVRRYHEMFYTPFHTDTKVVVGNHDIGFHYM